MPNNTISEKDRLEMYKRIVEHMSESIWIGNENEETIYANPNFCNLLGYKLEEMEGRKSYDFWDEESIKTVKNNNKKRKKGDASKYEGLLKAKDGTLIPVLLSGTPIPGGTVGIMTDLREVKSLKEVEEKLRNLNKTKDEFISIVGHELRTPLTAIKGYLSMILEGDMGELNPMMKKSIQHSYDSTLRLIELVNDMLCIGKIEAGNMTYYIEKQEVLPIFMNVYTDIKIEANRKNIVLEVEISHMNGVKANVDENKLKQVLLNLLTNSIKFTNEGGKITMRLINKGEKILFEVEDTGEGIPEKKLKSLFGKFVQVESALQRKNTSGLGLGLAISKEFIEKFGGDIGVESEVGVGSKFYFELNSVE